MKIEPYMVSEGSLVKGAPTTLCTTSDGDAEGPVSVFWQLSDNVASNKSKVVHTYPKLSLGSNTEVTKRGVRRIMVKVSVPYAAIDEAASDPTGVAVPVLSSKAQGDITLHMVLTLPKRAAADLTQAADDKLHRATFATLQVGFVANMLNKLLPEFFGSRVGTVDGPDLTGFKDEASTSASPAIVLDGASGQIAAETPLIDVNDQPLVYRAANSTVVPHPVKPFGVATTPLSGEQYKGSLFVEQIGEGLDREDHTPKISGAVLRGILGYKPVECDTVLPFVGSRAVPTDELP